MRILITTSANYNHVSFDHLPLLVGTIHKWLGTNNAIHGTTSLYSFSWLQGGKQENGGLCFSKGASFFISAHDEGLAKQIVKGAMGQPELFAGMLVKEIRIQDTPVFDRDEEYFSVASPILIKVKEETRVKHCLYNDPEANEVLTRSMQRKMDIAGIDPTGMSISFDPDYRSAHTKLINYKGIGNRASICPVMVKGSPEQIAFVWNVGVGHSTGIGFGALN
ncbi:CRISPR-associated endoribonuclease Cas6 [Roseivirga sp. UBA1976]|uniref:CRISPR-associated endoribonuclease Cas6 n=1 Tax=Roseivirga sp. UBA1976 TaxID=1947386 RepID=UPI00257AEA88|nr:CRISPR-associated endoribonuclease Cas6 [Roseivirga sp. UBA1976]MEC7754914.1 CRISPR-associated endoribonuclease Cas6 [Bacteroidota bacterium]|tara:strand:+ start:7168 stop:7830 length:663 start_codon:yes stop_codon:yes gene_type:complete